MTKSSVESGHCFHSAFAYALVRDKNHDLYAFMDSHEPKGQRDKRPAFVNVSLLFVACKNFLSSVPVTVFLSPKAQTKRQHMHNARMEMVDEKVN